jgi:rSAM/selenodomain-associated transferase 1
MIAVRPAIALFAKAPVPGRVKTRLAFSFSAERAARLHSCFVRDMFEMLRAFETHSSLQLHTDVITDEWDDIEVARFLQTDGDLGARMLHALQAGLAEGRPQVLIAGSDAPTLPPSHLSRLLASPADVALGPTDDGGFYAICCRRTHPRMFAGVRWSQPNTLQETLRAVGACGLSVELGEPWYDIDTPADLLRLAGSADLPRHTAAWLASASLTGLTP